MSRRASLAWSTCAVCVTVAAWGWRTLENGFLNFDDPQMVLENELLQPPTWDGVVEAFRETRNDARLPFYTLALMPEAAIAGLDPAAFHLGSLIWHAANAWLVLVVMLAVSGRRFVSLGAALVFAAHPVALESVAWVAGRKDQVSLFFLLAGLLVFVGHVRRGGAGRLVTAVVLFLIGCFAKASVVVFPGLCLVAGRALAAGDSSIPRRRWLVTPLALVGVALVPAVFHYVVASQSGAGGAAASHGTAAGFGLGMEALGAYLWHVLFPVNLAIHYHVPVPDGMTAGMVTGLCVFVALVACTVLFFRGRLRWTGFACAAIACSLVPFNNVFPRTSVPLADRYLAVGLPFIGVLIASALARLGPRARVGALAAVVAALAVASFDRAADFRDSEATFRVAHERDAADPLPPLKLGEHFAAAGDLESAILWYSKAVGVAHEAVLEVRARLKLGDSYLKAGRFGPALAEFDRINRLRADGADRFASLGLDPALIEYQRATCLFGLGRSVDGRAVLDGILKEHPGYPWARFLSGRIDADNGLRALGREAPADTHARARELVERGIGTLEDLLAQIEAEPSPLAADVAEALAPQVHESLARCALRARWIGGWRLRAASHADRVVDLLPESAASYCLRAEVYGAVGDRRRVLLDLAAADALHSRDPNVLLDLAQLYRGVNANRKAREKLLEILAIDPAHAPAKTVLADLFRAQARHWLNVGDARRARDAVQEALRLKPDLADAHVVLAQLHESAKAWQKAREAYEMVLALDPDNPEAHLGLARYFQALGLGRLSNLRKEVEKVPEAERPARRRAILEEVAAAYRAALEHGKDAPDVALARTYLKEQERARQKTLASAYIGKAEKALLARDRKGAIARLEEGARHCPTVPRVFMLLAELHHDDRNWDATLAASSKVLALEPGNLRSLFLSMRCHYIKGEMSSCRTFGERLLSEIGPKPGDSRLKKLLAEVQRVLKLATGKSGEKTEPREDG